MRTQESAINNERPAVGFSESREIMRVVGARLIDSCFHGQRVVAVPLTATQSSRRNTIADYGATPSSSCNSHRQMSPGTPIGDQVVRHVFDSASRANSQVDVLYR